MAKRHVVFGEWNLYYSCAQGTSMQSSCFWSTRTCWWVLLGMTVMSLRISCFRFSIWSKKQFSSPQRPNHQPQQQLMQHKLPLQIQSPAKTATKWQKKLLFIFVIVMIIVSTGIFYHFYQDTVFRRRETLSNMCDERARMLQDQFNAGLNHVHALAILVSTFHHGKSPTAMDQVTVWFDMLFKLLILYMVLVDFPSIWMHPHSLRNRFSHHSNLSYFRIYNVSIKFSL